MYQKTNEVISKKNFAIKVKNAIEEYYSNDGEERIILIDEFIKNNGITLTGISIRDSKSNVSPTLYLDKFYDEYLEGKSFGEIFKDFINIYEASKPTCKFNIDFFQSYDKVKSRIVYKVINKEKNEKLLNMLPHYEKLNLIMVFYYLLDDGSDFENGTILITNNHLKLWKITKDTLLEDAILNTPTILSPVVVPLSELIVNSLGKENVDGLDCNEMNNLPMYVLTNERKLYGAACLFYNCLMDGIAEKLNSDLIILPSSVHELILIPSNMIDDYHYLFEMVKEVNNTAVSPEEILSDEVYIYRREKDNLELLSA